MLPVTCVAAAARQGEVVARAHLDEARGGAVELEGLAAGLGLVEVRRLGLGGDEQLDVVLVERVDQGDEALGLVAPVGAGSPGRLDDDRVEGAREREVVGRAERPLAEVGEGEAGDAHRPAPAPRPDGPCTGEAHGLGAAPPVRRAEGVVQRRRAARRPGRGRRARRRASRAGSPCARRGAPPPSAP